MPFFVFVRLILFPCQHHRGGAKYRAPFVHGFIPFRLRNRIGHDACTCLNVQFFIFDDCCANSNRRIHVTAPAEITNRAAINAAFFFFQFVDDFHRANFWRAG